MPRPRKLSLEERQAQMREVQLQKRREQDRRHKVDAHQVELLAMVGLSIRQIAAELGCSETILHVSYRQAIEKGWVRAGIFAQKVMYQKLVEGDLRALRYYFWKFNGELIPVGPDPKLWGRQSRKSKSPEKSPLGMTTKWWTTEK